LGGVFLPLAWGLPAGWGVAQTFLGAGGFFNPHEKSQKKLPGSNCRVRKRQWDIGFALAQKLGHAGGGGRLPFVFESAFPTETSTRSCSFKKRKLFQDFRKQRSKSGAPLTSRVNFRELKWDVWTTTDLPEGAGTLGGAFRGNRPGGGSLCGYWRGGSGRAPVGGD